MQRGDITLSMIEEAKARFEELANLYMVNNPTDQDINDAYPYLNRKAWFKQKTLWMSLIGSAVGISMSYMGFSVEQVSISLSTILFYIGKEWHNDIKNAPINNLAKRLRR